MPVNDGKKRCFWCNLDNDLYVKYHDEEWGVVNFDERYLFEMLVLESFQAGLSWETVLNKREAFRLAYDNFDVDKVAAYDEQKIEELKNNKDIIRHSLKIKSSINNAIVFKEIQQEFGSFHNYLKNFIPSSVIYENHRTTSPLSDELSADLKKRGMKFIGSTIIYSYLQAIGVINSHDDDCFLFRKSE